MTWALIKLDIHDRNVLYFYQNPELLKQADFQTSFDSLNFKRNANYQIAITHSPTWSVREQLQLDMTICMFRY